MKSNIPVRPHMGSIGKDLQVNLKRSWEDEPGNQSRAQGSAEDWDHGTRSQRRAHDLISAWEEEERRVRSIQERSGGEDLKDRDMQKIREREQTRRKEKMKS